MTFYNREGILYVRLNGRRLSTTLEDTPSNRKLVTSYYKNDEFFNKFDLNNNSPIVNDLCLEVLKEKENCLKISTIRSYYSLFNNRIKEFFNKPVNQYKARDIEIWYKTFTDKQTILSCEAILKPAFEKAIIRGYIDNTPLLISKPRLKSNYVVKPYTLQEVSNILNYESSNYKWFINFFAISVFTGLRTGELLALKWSDLDFVNLTIDVQRTFNNGYESTPKTKSSMAIIDMPHESIEYFKKQRLKTGLKEYVFYSSRGLPIKTSHNLNRLLKIILKDLNIPFRNMYQTRHTFASLKLSYGERLEWVSYMLRHKDTSVTLKKYFKYIPNKQESRVVFDIHSMAQNRHTI